MLVRRSWMIAATALIFSIGASLILNWIHVPRYQASMTYAVTARQAASNNLSATRQITGVLAQMLESDMVYTNIRAASEELAAFSGTVTGQQVGSSNTIIVTSEADSPEDAIYSMLALQDFFPTIVSYVTSDALVQVIRAPEVSLSPLNPVDTVGTAAAAAAIGGAGMALLLCHISICRETVQTRSGARDLLDAPIIASVSRTGKGRKNRQPAQVFSAAAGFTFTEQINTICTRMELEAADSGRKIFLITSVSKDEGKTTISGNVAAALAMRGKKTALLDCDLRNPSLNRLFGGQYASNIPLNRLLRQPLSETGLLRSMVRHGQTGLYMFLAAEPDRRSTELLTGKAMARLLEQLRVFDFVILDTPPLGLFADVEALADAVDASILVVRQNCTPAVRINDACGLLQRAKSHFMGIVLNDMTASLTEGCPEPGSCGRSVY